LAQKVSGKKICECSLLAQSRHLKNQHLNPFSYAVSRF